MPDLTTLGIADAGRLMARGELTSTALTETFLNRIKAVDHKIASYITVTAELALAAARQADMEMKGGVRRGPMHGIPVALKDIYEVIEMSIASRIKHGESLPADLQAVETGGEDSIRIELAVAVP